MAGAGDGVVGLAEALGAARLEHAEEAALVELAEGVIDVVGVAAVEVEVIAVDAMEGAPDGGDVVVGEDVVGEEGEEAGAAVAVGEDLEEDAHFIKNVGDEEAGAGVLDHADEGAGVEAAAVAGDLGGEDDEVAGSAEGVAVEEVEGRFAAGAGAGVDLVEEDEVVEGEALVIVGEFLQQLAQLVFGVAQARGGAVEVGLDVGFVAGEGLFADGGEHLDVAVGVHEVPGGLDHAGLHVHPGGAGEPAQGLVELVDEDEDAAVEGAEAALERAFHGVEGLAELADAEGQQFFEDEGGLDGAALEQGAQAAGQR